MTSTIEARLLEIEQRLAVVENQLRSGAEPKSEANNTAASPEEKIKVEVFNKRFDPSNPDLSSYEDHIWFDCKYLLASESKATRAVKGTLEFADIFGEVQFRIQCTLNEALIPNKPYFQKGIGFAYNQFMQDHLWMLATDLKDMKVRFRVRNIIFSDGTSESVV
jgi:hypothetical protein